MTAGAPIDVVTAFIVTWGGGGAALRRGIECYFTDATLWENVGINRLIGAGEALAFIDGYHRAHGLDAIRVDMLAIAADGAHVLTERVDHLVRADGTTIQSVRLMGLFEIGGGKVLVQRDYFNPTAR